MNKHYKQYYKRFFIYFLVFGLLNIAVTGFIFTKDLARISDNEIQLNAEAEFARFVSELSHFLESSARQVHALKESESVQRLFVDSSVHEERHFGEAVRVLLAASDAIYQLRLIGSDGKELMRAFKDDIESKQVAFAKASALQDKSSRYYFRKTILLEDNAFYYSDLDLNVENGEIETPHRPTIRISMPVYHDEQVVGVIVANIAALHFLNTIADTRFFNNYIVDENGNILFGNMPEFNWSSQLKTHHGIETLEKQSENLVNRAPVVYELEPYLGSGQNLKLFSYPTLNMLSAIESSQYSNALNSFIFIFTASLILAVFLSRVPARNASKVAIMGGELKRKAVIIDTHVPIIETDHKLRIVEANIAYNDIFGTHNDDLVNKAVKIRREGEQVDLAEIKACIATNNYWLGESHETTKGGESLWLEKRIVHRFSPDGEHVGFTVICTDITDKMKVTQLAERDALTNIYNRRKLNNSLLDESSRSQRYQSTFCVLIFDIDHFKQVNDLHGFPRSSNIR
ncbi:diguanylate cyclase [Enterovibrio paralichthyis]|uniref:diguanylate cyclase n=1 Tax=Enterovibrio paralichthyis TaxID=2853805 RepID=UPI001C4631B4|nr:diguanylate cyclase [Enterovibrio paralichthyis]